MVAWILTSLVSAMASRVGGPGGGFHLDLSLKLAWSKPSSSGNRELSKGESSVEVSLVGKGSLFVSKKCRSLRVRWNLSKSALVSLRSGSPGVGQKFRPLESSDMWCCERIRLDKLTTLGACVVNEGAVFGGFVAVMLLLFVTFTLVNILTFGVFVKSPVVGEVRFVW